VRPLNDGWTFRRLADSANGHWAKVHLPHCPFTADLDGRDHWFGECEYQRSIRTPVLAEGERVMLHVGAAMHTAHVLVDQREITCHEGGYLPFVVDLTDPLADGGIF